MNKAYLVIIAAIALGLIYYFQSKPENISSNNDDNIAIVKDETPERPKVESPNIERETSTKPQTTAPAPLPATPTEANNSDDRSSEIITAINSLAIPDDKVNSALIDLVMGKKIDVEMVSDYLITLGPQGFPALGALADRLNKVDPEKSQFIVNYMFDAINTTTDQSEVSMIAGSLYNAHSVDFLDKLYTTIQNTPNEETRSKLYGALMDKRLAPEEKERFKSLALNDPSPMVKVLGQQWEKIMEGKN